MRGVKAVLSGTGLISGVGGVAALAALNRAPAASVLEVVEEKPQVEEKKEEVTVVEPAPVMDVYVVGYKLFNGSSQPLVDEISPNKLTNDFIAMDGEAKKCSLSGNVQGRSYVYWDPKQKQLMCNPKFQWKDWLTVSDVKKTQSLGEVELSEKMERVHNLRTAIFTFKEEGHDDDTFKKGCEAVYDLTFKDGMGSNFCRVLLFTGRV
ncbi:hypothetical protein HF1_01420 [Mycoplasma haemofelis str. Langford 1]|uniref:Uncharacterized protein n=1 Tax=Mycoplasma haemofelis (strain Langford 1) TaxID=941640 RepID=E8ZKI4_MYCHL|nr:hypothetical protein [Mycoplasma haemofelis]CBY92150.1 hypothetical protein HF1_01420 [Mycoplasma haemofelis str. Langford 1]